MNQAKFARLFSIVLLSVLFIGTVQYGWRIGADYWFGEDKFAKGTMIGPFDVSEQTKSTSGQLLETEIQKWQAAANIQLMYHTEQIRVPASLFTFHIEDALQEAAHNPETSIQAIVDQEGLRTLLLASLQEQVAQYIKMDELALELEKAAGTLSLTKTAQIAPFIDEQEGKKTVSETYMKTGDVQADELQEWVEKHPSFVVAAKQELSFLQMVNEKGTEASDETLSFIASLLYKAILPTNFEVTKRSISYELPPYAELGEEARVEQGKSDFIMLNPNETAYAFSFSMQGDTLSVKVEGLPFVHAYGIDRSHVSPISKRTIVQAVIPGGKHDAITSVRDGEEGYEVKVYRDMYHTDGTIMERKLIAEDYYLHVHSIEHIFVVPDTPAASSDAPSDSAAANETGQIEQ